MFIDVDNYERADIKSLYSGATVLVTGSSGFVGKVLVEFLLRKTGVKRIYLLLRSQKNKSADVRLKELLGCTIFDYLRENKPDRLSVLIPLNGDVILPGLGLTEEDKNKILNEVEIIFHGAASLSFNQKLADAAEINLFGTRRVLEISRNVHNLKVLMHISTAFTYWHMKEIDEEIHPIKDIIKIWKFDKKIDDENFNCRSVEICPNTYILTKLLAEQMLLELYSDLPVGILRPGVVIGALKEPVPGWVDNLYGPTGLSIGIMTGVIHSTLIRRDFRADLIPVDLLVNCLISATWDTYSKFIMNGPESKHIPVYNAVVSPQSPITWGQVLDAVLEEGRAQPPSNSVWFPFALATSSLWVYRAVTLVCHYLPAFVADAASLLYGKKPKWMKLYKKVDDITTVLLPFATNEWVFRNDNVQSLWNNMSPKEKEQFPFDFEEIDWKDGLPVYLKGIKKYVINRKGIDEDNTKTKQRLVIMHYSLTASAITLFLALLLHVIPS